MSNKSNHTTCIEEDCENKHYARGYCHKHYSAKRASGELPLIERPTKCSVNNCENKPRTRGMCHKHYERARRTSESFAVPAT